MVGRGLELKVPPVALVLLTGLIMWLAAWAVPGAAFALAGRRAIALGCLVGGLAVSALGVASFRRARTTVDPRKPTSSSSLVRSGIYGLTRNPMYLGFALVLLGWGVSLSNAIALVFVPVFIAYITRFQVQPEERALGSSFGREFAEYRSRVRRWL